MMRYGQIGLAVLMLSAGGCAVRGNAELLESQLRQQEDQLYALKSQLNQTETDLNVARREVEALRVQLAERGDSILLPEQSQALFRVAGVRVQKLLTGGLDRDGLPGDDLLNVVIVPHDEQGETVKLPGELEIEAIDLTAPEGSRQLGVWRFTPEEVADHWQTGLTAGFQFRMPWQLPPSSDDIVLHARYHTADGRRYGTSAEVHVTPLPAHLVERHRRMTTQARLPDSPGLSSLPPAPEILPHDAGELEIPAAPPAAPVVREHDPHGKMPIIQSRSIPSPPEEREVVPDPASDEADSERNQEAFPRAVDVPHAPAAMENYVRFPVPENTIPVPAPKEDQNASPEPPGNAALKHQPASSQLVDQPRGSLVWTSLDEVASEPVPAKASGPDGFQPLSVEPLPHPRAEEIRADADEIPRRYQRTSRPLSLELPGDSSNPKPPW